MKKSFCRGLWTGFVILSWGTGASGQEDVGLGPQAGTPPAIASPAFAPPAVPPAPVPTPPPATVPPQARATADKPAPPEELVLDTTDGLALHVWHYPAKVAEDAKPTATVILLHDIEGSHRSVETLAQALQAAGCDVVAPDLRGHGASTARPGGAIDLRTLKKADVELMAAARGGQIRDQSAIRGDVETVRNWIRRQAEDGNLDMKRLFVVGSGLGAAVAAAWTAEDANWPAGTKGDQGRQVRGLVLLSPAWTTRGFSITGALANDAVRTEVPVMVIAGRADRDAAKVFDQLKRQRPTSWFQQRADGTKDKAAKLDDPARASLFFFEFDSTRTADPLASDRTLNPAGVIAKFFGMALARPKR
jgi:alpha-beta hydrolase superfamily lysophospholipase